jgi:hypothetical protein
VLIERTGLEYDGESTDIAESEVVVGVVVGGFGELSASKNVVSESIGADWVGTAWELFLSDANTGVVVGTIDGPETE